MRSDPIWDLNEDAHYCNSVTSVWFTSKKNDTFLMFPHDYKGAALLFVGKNSNKNADILLNTLLPTGHTHCCIVFCDSSDGQRLVFVNCDKPEVTKDRCTFDA